MNPEKIVVIGTGRLACACLESCLFYTRNVECVEPELPMFSTLKSICDKSYVKYRCIAGQAALTGYFKEHSSPTLVVSAYNSFIFPEAVLANPSLNLVNFHNSLLPRHRGRNAPTWTIFEMDALAGITWHQIDPEIDSGRIICQRSFKTPPDITAIALTRKTLELGAQTFEEILPSLLDGTYSIEPISDREKGTCHRSIDVPNGGNLDPAWDFTKIYAFLRSMDYGKIRVFPPAHICLLGQQCLVLNYSAVLKDTAPAQGISMELRDDQLVLHDRTTCLTIQFRKKPA